LIQPLIFEPIFMERIWGGRRLESLYGKRLPSAALIGESWEIVDRPEAQSVVHAGQFGESEREGKSGKASPQAQGKNGRCDFSPDRPNPSAGRGRRARRDPG